MSKYVYHAGLMPTISDVSPTTGKTCGHTTLIHYCRSNSADASLLIVGSTCTVSSVGNTQIDACDLSESR